MSVFSKKIKDLKDLPDGARVAIPNDPTNGGRALLVLQSAGLIKLRDGAPITATPQDITENKRIFNSLNWRRHSSPARWKTLIFPLSISILPWKQN